MKIVEIGEKTGDFFDKTADYTHMAGRTHQFMDI